MDRTGSRITRARGAFAPAIIAWSAAAAPGVGQSVSPVDGKRISEVARDVQGRFERTRRRHFPRGAWDSGSCHEHIGRFCLRHDGDEGWVPPPEPAEVVDARTDLLAALDSLAALLPTDRWITGQRVKYRVEAAEVAEALAIARSCPDAWPCASLEGFVLHWAGRYGEAGLAYDRALAAMPAESRCAWTDLEPLLDGPDRDHYRRLSCGSDDRRRFEDMFWHLSDPLWSVPGLERRSEHFTRRVWGTLQMDAASGYGLSWGSDLEEITVRYGWPAGWDVAWRRDPGLRTERAIRSHRPVGARRYVADGIGGRGEGRLAWDLDRQHPRSYWAHPDGSVGLLEAQVAVFRRGDRALVVGAFDRPPTPCERPASLILATRERVLTRSETAGGRVLTALEPPGEPAALAGLEVRCPDASTAWRSRTELDRASKALSDLLLLAPGEGLPGTLDAALSGALGSTRVRSGGAIVVFWEWYGTDEPLATTLTLDRREASFWRKALEWTGLARRGIDRAGLRWLDPGAEGGAGRAVRVELPGLSPGEYRLSVQVQSAREGTVISTRDLVVER